MTPYTVLFGGFVVTWGLTWLLWARPRFAPLVDQPNERSLHTRPTSRSGGIAIAIGFTSSMVVAIAEPSIRAGQAVDSRILWIVSLACPLFLTSLYNDWRGLRPAVRLAIQLAVTTVLVVATGLRFAHIAVPLAGSLPLDALSAPVTVLLLVWMMNLYNFMDGMDGFAGGMSVIGFGFLAATTTGAGSLVAALVAACCLGFLAHNFPPARIFMGDTGSIPLGYLAGAIALFGVKTAQLDLVQPILMFSPFIIDATVTLTRRMYRRERVWQPHRQHAYQRLVLAGWSHRRTVLWAYGLMLAAGTSGVLYGRLGEASRFVMLTVWLVVYMALAQLVRKIEHDVSRPA